MAPLLLAQALAAPPAVPVDVRVLPTLALVQPGQLSPSASDFVRDEVRAGRCAAAVATPRGQMLTVDLAVLVVEGGQVRRLLPRAIGCSTVEQYASGLVSRLIRENMPASRAAGWYRTSVAFHWEP